MANIFFIMPFSRPGLNYMYLHLKSLIENDFAGTRCVRGDTNISTGFLISKIKANLEEADIVIADCSGHNPNVFYELGIAHTLGKQVVIIHCGTEPDVPTDIQAYERLMYGFDDHEAFGEKIRKVLSGLILDKYDILYDRGTGYLNAFNQARAHNFPAKDKAAFRTAVMSRESAAKLPSLDDNRQLATYLMPIVANISLDLDIATEMKEWIGNAYPS